MRVGSESSIFSLFMPKRTKGPSISDGGIAFKTAESPKTPPIKSDDQLLADLYDNTAQQLIDDADIDGDGMLSRDEYLGAQKRLANANDRIFDQQAAEERWAKFDPNGKGTIDKSEVIEGLKTILPLKVGHLDAATVNAIQNRPPTRY